MHTSETELYRLTIKQYGVIVLFPDGWVQPNVECLGFIWDDGICDRNGKPAISVKKIGLDETIK